MFRHSTATELLARGASIDVVKELLGHASIRSTEAYLHPDVDALRAAVDRLGPLGMRRDPMKPLRRVATAAAKPQAVEPLSRVLDYPLLIGWGYDPATQIFAPDPDHPLLGYPVCRVAGCGVRHGSRADCAPAAGTASPPQRWRRSKPSHAAAWPGRTGRGTVAAWSAGSRASNGPSRQTICA